MAIKTIHVDKLDLSQVNQGVQFPSLTTAERDALTGVGDGTLIYNESLEQLELYYDPPNSAYANQWAPLGDLSRFFQEAQRNMSGGGTVSYSSTAKLKWTDRVISIPVPRRVASSGFFQIDCPNTGTISYWGSGNVGASTTGVSSLGIPFGSTWEALYYRCTPGASSAFSQANLHRVDYRNTQWESYPGDLIVATKNADDDSIKWHPGQINIPKGGTLTSSTGACSWL